MFTRVKMQDGRTILINLDHVVDIQASDKGGTNILMNLDARHEGLYWYAVEESLETMEQKLTARGLI